MHSAVDPTPPFLVQLEGVSTGERPVCTYGPLDWAGQTTCRIDRVKKRPRDLCGGSAAKCPRFSELEALDNQASLPVACSPGWPVLRAWGCGHAAGCKQGSCKPLLAAWTIYAAVAPGRAFQG